MAPSSQALPVPVRFTKNSVREGQTLLLSGYYADRPKEVRVLKVGRTIITVDLNGMETKFDMMTGRGKRDYRFLLGTVDQYADDIRRRDLWRELKKYGIEMMSDSRAVSTSKLERILKVLQS